jgi:hypothetical protein
MISAWMILQKMVVKRLFGQLEFRIKIRILQAIFHRCRRCNFSPSATDVLTIRVTFGFSLPLAPISVWVPNPFAGNVTFWGEQIGSSRLQLYQKVNPHRLAGAGLCAIE